MVKGCLWFLLLFLLLSGAPVWANGESLYGVHWWDFNGSQAGEGAEGGWSTETVLTHSAPWWGASYFQPLYQSITANHGASVITRIDYDWGQTIPAPTNPDRATWAISVLGVVNTLGGSSNVWIIGNEPNIIGEGNGWTNNRITPQGYADVYHEIRSAIKLARPDDEVLVAPPSPGGVIGGVRWMDGNTWLSQTIAAIQAIPGGEIDGFGLHAYGNPFASANAAVTEFHNSYVSQLSVIDAHGEQDAPVYLTEWARSTSTSGNLANNEAVTADFIRGSFEDVHAWNQTPGNHNIVSLSWFVHNQDYGGWNEYSLEYWKNMGNPVGNPGDLWTAFQEGANYPAGLKGTRPLPTGPSIGDFDNDGDVDGADFLRWQRGLNLTGGALPDQGDANGDGFVNAADRTVWQNHYGMQSGSNLKQVPEPKNLLLQIGLLTLLMATTALRW
ncbi:dockerin type I domain-containing protein [Bythopirellula polymerisocia]|uniref:Asl1-like glycosyl hydrolase catalytic domain-containing protein n=1 Tax=Bythopirellula polymerisocia TaxID=2528003 RepID=A0A5C6CGV0_9BACT|nr:dockerin type I domain-containing protein [Bythopirellula polymerisocia]TWU22794.1 hypothetical protein Pla144_42550 [Bythopirellula polymerisocia]